MADQQHHITTRVMDIHRKWWGYVYSTEWWPKMSILTSQTHSGEVTLSGKRDFADVLKIRIWDEKIILHYPLGPNKIIGTLIEGDRGHRQRKEVKTDLREPGRWHVVPCSSEDGGGGAQTIDASFEINILAKDGAFPAWCHVQLENSSLDDFIAHHKGSCPEMQCIPVSQSPRPKPSLDSILTSVFLLIPNKAGCSHLPIRYFPFSLSFSYPTKAFSLHPLPLPKSLNGTASWNIRWSFLYHPELSSFILSNPRKTHWGL